MTPDVLVPACLAVVVALGVALLLVLLRDRSRTRAELEATHAEAADLRARIDALAVQVAAARRVPEEYVITHVGEELVSTDSTSEAAQREDSRIDGKLFADLVLRETVVKAAALGHGVRRAMAPETRNRIRFEMRREVKRSRKERRAELKRVRREMQDRQRAATA